MVVHGLSLLNFRVNVPVNTFMIHVPIWQNAQSSAQLETQSQQSAAVNQGEVFHESTDPDEPTFFATMQQPPELADSWWSPLQNPKPDYSEIGLESVSWVGSCIIAAAITQEPWTHDADFDPISDHETSPINQIESPLSSKWPIYINEALNKSWSKLS